MLSHYTLPFSKTPHPTVKIHTFHWSAANGLYWLYTIIYIRPVHAIRLYTIIFENDSIDYSWSMDCIVSPDRGGCILNRIRLQLINLSAVSFTSDLSMLSDSTLPFSKMPNPTEQIHTFHRSAANGFYWLYTIIYIRPVHAIRLYTVPFSNMPHPTVQIPKFHL